MTSKEQTNGKRDHLFIILSHMHIPSQAIPYKGPFYSKNRCPSFLRSSDRSSHRFSSDLQSSRTTYNSVLTLDTKSSLPLPPSHSLCSLPQSRKIVGALGAQSRRWQSRRCRRWASAPRRPRWRHGQGLTRSC